MAAQLAIGREILQQAGTQAALLDTARGWIERAAASGSVEARYQLAEHYLAQDPDGEPGRHWLLAAADSGHEQALRKVITGFREATHGLPRDLEKSRAYSEALFTVLEARGVLKNEPDWLRASREYSETRQQIRAEADRYLPPEELRRQSDAGDPAAMYHRGRELQPTRFAEGVALITAAATAGYPQAQYEMARSYRTRARTQQEEQQAVDWLEAAAQRGHRGAMVDLGILYLQGIRSIGLEANPYRAKRLFAQALRDRKDTVYEQQTGNGRSWKYTVESVNRWLGRIPESVTRLDLEGLVGTQRREAIERWYAQEQQALLAQVDASSVGVQPPLQKQLEQLDQQRNALLNEDREAAE